jgi:hypothetical protein
MMDSASRRLVNRNVATPGGTVATISAIAASAITPARWHGGDQPDCIRAVANRQRRLGHTADAADFDAELHADAERRDATQPDYGPRRTR